MKSVCLHQTALASCRELPAHLRTQVSETTDMAPPSVLHKCAPPVNVPRAMGLTLAHTELVWSGLSAGRCLSR